MKDKRISIRISPLDLTGIQKRTAKEGTLPNFNIQYITQIYYQKLNETG